MKLATAGQVRGHLGVSDIPIINAAIDEKLELATARLAMRLRTSFDRVVDQEDLFYITSSLDLSGAIPMKRQLENLEYRTGAPAVVARLALSRGFLDAGATAIAATSLPNLDDAPETMASLSATLRVNQELGLCEIWGTQLAGKFVRVTYTSGFVDSGGQAQGVPEWLQQLAAISAALSMYGNPVMQTSSGSDEEDPDLLRDQVNHLLSGKTRYLPGAFAALS